MGGYIQGRDSGRTWVVSKRRGGIWEYGSDNEKIEWRWKNPYAVWRANDAVKRAAELEAEVKRLQELLQ